jgi:hypothetical protein
MKKETGTGSTVHNERSARVKHFGFGTVKPVPVTFREAI